MAVDLEARLGFDNNEVFGRRFPLAVKDHLFGLLDECLKTPRADGLEQWIPAIPTTATAPRPEFVSRQQVGSVDGMTAFKK